MAAASVGVNDSNLNPDDRDDRLIDLNGVGPTDVCSVVGLTLCISIQQESFSDICNIFRRRPTPRLSERAQRVLFTIHA